MKTTTNRSESVDLCKVPAIVRSITAEEQIQDFRSFSTSDQLISNNPPSFISSDNESNRIENEHTPTFKNHPSNTLGMRTYTSSSPQEAKPPQEGNENDIVEVINENDVLFGRGGEVNQHKGNVRYRKIVHRHKTGFLEMESKKGKKEIACSIIDEVCTSSPAGRFLRRNDEGLWYRVDMDMAIRKTSQALREDAPKICKKLLIGKKRSFSPSTCATQKENDGKESHNSPHIKTKTESCLCHHGDGGEPETTQNNVITSSVSPILTSQEKDIIEVNENDVLFIRGNRHHSGNVRYRSLVKKYPVPYLRAQSDIEKKLISRFIADAIISEEELSKKTIDGKWYQVDVNMTALKTSQALREGTPSIRKSRLKPPGCVYNNFFCSISNTNTSNENSINEKTTKNHSESVEQVPVIVRSLTTEKQIQDIRFSSTSNQLISNKSVNHPSSVSSNNEENSSSQTKNELTPTFKNHSSDTLSTDTNTLPSLPETKPPQGEVINENDVLLNRGREVINENDVIFGRGTEVNQHKGNIRYRTIVNQHKTAFQQTKSIEEKEEVACSILDEIRTSSPEGRFLKNGKGLCYQVDADMAIRKTTQTFRDNASKIRTNVLIGKKRSLSSSACATQKENVVKRRHNSTSTMIKACLSRDHEDGEQKLTGQKSDSTSSMLPTSTSQEEDIIEVNEKDVLCGRGNKHHAGNVRYRSYIKKYLPRYLQAQSDTEKMLISRFVVDAIKHEGRFLKQNIDGKWYQINVNMAVSKTANMLKKFAESFHESHLKPPECIRSKMVRNVSNKNTNHDNSTKPKRTRNRSGCVDLCQVPVLARIVTAEEKIQNSISSSTSNQLIFTKASISPPLISGENEENSSNRMENEHTPALKNRSSDTLSKKTNTSPSLLKTKPPQGEVINENDILFGRGGEVNQHKGNVRFRGIVNRHKIAFLQSMSSEEKKKIARGIVDEIRTSSPAGRFLKKNGEGLWYQVDMDMVIRKISQALREGAPKMRKKLSIGNIIIKGCNVEEECC